MKLTKRKAFNFLRSYFDVLNKLQTDEDKLSFLLAVINKQFLNENPELLQFPVDLAYDSQINAIDSSVKGWMRAAKTDLQGNSLYTPPTPPQGKTHSDPEEEEEEEKEEHTYTESVFLENWTNCRLHYLKKPTFIKNLNFIENNLFSDLKKQYNKEEINNAMLTLFKQERIPVDAMVLRPRHFLEKFDTYYSGINNTKIYGSNV